MLCFQSSDHFRICGQFEYALVNVTKDDYNREQLLVPRVCLQFVIVVFPDHTHLLF